MSSKPSLASLDPAEAAARWRARLDDPSATEADWHALETWLATAEENRAAYLALDLAMIDAEDALRAEPAADNIVHFQPRHLLRHPAPWVAALAATLAIAVMIPSLAPRPPVRLAYAAPAGQDRQVSLPDGSEIHLNRGASITASLGKTRRVSLDHGEASFSVHHDAAHPFEVTVNGISIRDIGTKFNVAPRARGVVVTVSEGTVAIGGVTPTVRVDAGNRATINGPGRVLVELASHSDDAFSWRKGQLVYHDAPLAEVVDDLRAYGAQNVRIGPDVAQLRFSGVLAIDEPRLMLARLESFMPIRVREGTDEIVIRSR